MRTIILLLLLALPVWAEEPLLLELQDNDTAVVILDRVENGRRAPVVIPPAQSPGRVFVEYPEAEANEWTEVRWVLRFSLAKIAGPVKKAQLRLWCSSATGKPKAPPKVELIESVSPDRIVAQDRISDPLLPNAVEIAFPPNPDSVEVDVTAMVREALKRKLPFAAFRVSAISSEPKPGQESQAYHFGSSQNPWSWKHSEAPVLEITPH